MPAYQAHSMANKIYSAIRNDPKKAGILTLLASILLVLQVRLQMSKNGDPSSKASAASFLAPAKGDTTGAGVAGSTSAKSNDPSANTLKAWLNAPPTQLSRNLFAIDLDRYPTDGGHALSGGSGNSGFWDTLEKSMSSRADVRKERQILVENLQQQASQLHLQTTLKGASPKAVIDGAIVKEGDVVACGTGSTRTQFRVLKIEARRIIVEREGIKLEIQMK